MRTHGILRPNPPCPPWWRVICVLFVAYATLSASQTPPPNGQPAIKVGFIAPLSGPYAQDGRDILNGFLLYLEQVGYRAGGRSIELIVEDDEAIPAVGLTKARKLVERDK